MQKADGFVNGDDDKNTLSSLFKHRVRHLEGCYVDMDEYLTCLRKHSITPLSIVRASYADTASSSSASGEGINKRSKMVTFADSVVSLPSTHPEASANVLRAALWDCFMLLMIINVKMGRERRRWQKVRVRKRRRRRRRHLLSIRKRIDACLFERRKEQRFLN